MTRLEHLKLKLKAAQRELTIRTRTKNASDRGYQKVINTIKALHEKIELATAKSRP